MFLGATDNKYLIQIKFLLIQHQKDAYLRIILSYVCLRYPRQKFNPCKKGNDGDISVTVLRVLQTVVTYYFIFVQSRPLLSSKGGHDPGSSQLTCLLSWPSNKFKDGHLTIFKPMSVRIRTFTQMLDWGIEWGLYFLLPSCHHVEP